MTKKSGSHSWAGGVSWNGLTEVSVVFLAFALGETASPERSVGESGGGKISPRAKALENKVLKCGSEKKCPLPVSGYKIGIKMAGGLGFEPR